MSLLFHERGKPHAHPTVTCPCAACDAPRLRLFAALSPQQRHALSVLHPWVPRHAYDLYHRDGVRWRTLASLYMRGPRDRPALARQIELKRALYDAPYIAFYVLGPHGRDLFAAQGRAARKAA